DAYHMTTPEPEGSGAALALRRALEDAGTEAENVDFVNAHGTATRLNDLSEFHALERVFGTRARSIPVTSTKGSIGHLLGSAGAVEAVATALCLVHQLVHPTPGGGLIDPETPIRLVSGRGFAEAPLQVGVSLNLGFGGTNGALVFRRWSRA
ncbi:MAG: beta-ketoacyl-[acyl-carrier-protein] synthase II, partial [Acidobacteriota bacterium]|nr:beta-ketoacyl-[acyl-carrier-protein] synthase II [Acidobacteriota bacterium]